MKTISIVFVLLFIALVFACTSDKKSTDVSDSAITAPVDTLGGDTTRQNSMGDTTTKTNLDTAR